MNVHESKPALAAARYVRIHVAETLTGYTRDAIEKKIRTGVWIQGREYIRAPDGHVLVDMKGYERWAEGQRQAGSPNPPEKSG